MKTNGLDAYFQWAHKQADHFREKHAFALLFLALVGCATVPKHEISTPLAAFVFAQCGGALALYVIVDSTHVLRFDPKQTSIFTLDASGKMAETDGPPTDFKQALDLAATAPITSHVTAPCNTPGEST